MKKVVAVFGSSRVTQESPEGLLAYATGAALAQAGYAVISGGYEGIMEAVSRGAAQAGGHVIGVGSVAIERMRGVQTNPWVSEMVPFESLHDRMMYLVLKSDAYIVLPGGLGTLAELAVAWELVRVGDVPPRPLLCIGDYWADVLGKMRGSPYMVAEDWSPLEVVADLPQAIALLKERI